MAKYPDNQHITPPKNKGDGRLNSCCKSPGTAGQFTCRPSSPPSLEGLIKDYLNQYRQSHGDYLSSLRTTTDYICGEVNPVEAPSGSPYILNGHQWHLRFPSRRPTVDTVAALWEGRDKKTFTDFEELYAAVEKIKQPYFGDTCIYDFALRYGWNQDPRVVPERYVYIHSKPLESARRLFELGYIPKIARRLPLSDCAALLLPGMTAMDIEHFLCVYHRQIMKLK